MAPRTLTRKHYQLIAEALHQTMNKTPADEQHVVWEAAYKLSDSFEVDNPHFDKVRFVDWVDVGDPKKIETVPKIKMRVGPKIKGRVGKPVAAGSVGKRRPPVAVDDYIELLSMPDDPDPVLPGTLGRVMEVQPTQIKVNWESGKTLMLLPDVDEWKVVFPAASEWKGDDEDEDEPCSCETCRVARGEL